MYSLRHNLRIFLFHENSQVRFLKFSIFYILNKSIQFKSCDVMMLLGHEVGWYIFKYVRIVNHLVMKLDPLIDVVVMGSIFRKTFAIF